ncbi:TspO/MBR family protein [Aegicerativicinus sediminis]|uniref:TspO/MBR family protein n=1 Tax=Aegicerativicinus sediminis TaxID=2893202 RepID=UPI001E4C3A56|nr:TspO/MBR family protein [Aegicerativicinus sediminis]
MQFGKLLILYLVLNFAALGIGSWLMGTGPTGQWYLNLNKAPWTPPGWVFGFAWTTIMVCFSFYLTYLTLFSEDNYFKGLFAIQWVLNVSWNLIFFNLQLPLLGLIIICLLTIVVFMFLFKYWPLLKLKSILVSPYAIWLCIAVSLNAYIVFKN